MNDINFTPVPIIQGLVDENPIIIDRPLAPILMPVAPVSVPSAIYPKIGMGDNQILTGNISRNIDGTFKTFRFTVGQDSFYTEEGGLQYENDKTQALIFSNYFNSYELAARYARALLMLERDARAQYVFQTVSEFPADQQLSATASWSDPANADPEADRKQIKAAVEALNFRMGQMTAAIHETAIENIMKSTNMNTIGSIHVNTDVMPMAAKADYVARYFGFKRVEPLYKIYNDAGYGLPANFVDFWLSDIMTVYYEGAPGITSPGFAKQPVYTPYSSDYNMLSYENIDRKQVIVRVEEYRGTKVDYTKAIVMDGLD